MSGATNVYPRIKHERALRVSVPFCIYAPDKSTRTVYFSLSWEGEFSRSLARPFPSLSTLPTLFFSSLLFELLQQAPCNIFTLTDIKIHKQSELREMGKLILFPDNDWSKLVYLSENGYFLPMSQSCGAEMEKRILE